MVNRKEIIKKIDGYLEGKLTKRQVSEWAIQTLQKESFPVEEMLLEDTITSLSLLHDEDERFDVARDDVVFWKECLSGKKSYGLKIEFIAKKEKVHA